MQIVIIRNQDERVGQSLDWQQTPTSPRRKLNYYVTLTLIIDLFKIVVFLNFCFKKKICKKPTGILLILDLLWFFVWKFTNFSIFNRKENVAFPSASDRTYPTRVCKALVFAWCRFYLVFVILAQDLGASRSIGVVTYICPRCISATIVFASRLVSAMRSRLSFAASRIISFSPILPP